MLIHSLTYIYKFLLFFLMICVGLILMVLPSFGINSVFDSKWKVVLTLSLECMPRFSDIHW
jgi:hypothetical protein